MDNDDEGVVADIAAVAAAAGMVAVDAVDAVDAAVVVDEEDIGLVY